VTDRVDPRFFFRINAIFVFILAAVAALGVRLYYIQVVQHEFYRRKAREQQVVRITIPAKRGTIYDVNGMAIASTEKSQTICLVPAEINHKVDCVALFSDVFRMDPDVIRRKMASSKKLVYLKRKVSDAYAERIRRLNIPGIRFQTELKRTYPNGALFCHVVGFAGMDNHGLEGLEYYYDVLLTGRDGFQEINRNALSSSGSFIASRSRFLPQQDGMDIYLALDGYIQGVVEAVLKELVEEHDPDCATAVVMDPGTGRILAMANVPDFYPAIFNRYPASARRNRAVTDVYEPGSVMKIFTAAAAVEEGLDPDGETFDCENGVFFYKGRTLHDHHPYGEMTLRDIVVHSSNIGIAKVGIRLGKEKLYSYLKRFGFGARTGVGFPGEQPGYLKPLARWDSFTLSSVPMGHEITCTALQIVTAASALVNGGLLYRPLLVDRMTDGSGKVVRRFRPEVVRRVISPAASQKMRSIMRDVVERGTGRRARVPGVSVGGKTGTAQLLVRDPVTGMRAYSDTAYMASFCGFAPVEDPRVCVIVSVKNPKGKYHTGGAVAAPAVREIIVQTIDYITEPVTTVARMRVDVDGKAYP